MKCIARINVHMHYVCIYLFAFYGHFCVCAIANLVAVRDGLNMNYLFLIVLAPWPSNDVMAMQDPQAHFLCLISFLAFFF